MSTKGNAPKAGLSSGAQGATGTDDLYHNHDTVDRTAPAAGHRAARFYADRQVRVLRMLDKATPLVRGFGINHPDFTCPPETFSNSDLVGILCGPCPAIEPDWLLCVDRDGPFTHDDLVSRVGPLPDTLTSHGGRHEWYRVAPGDRRGCLKQWNDIFKTKEATGGAVDLKWAGGYACELGDWDGSFDIARIATLPESALDVILAARERVSTSPEIPDAGGPEALASHGFDPSKVLEWAIAYLRDEALVAVEGKSGHSALLVAVGGLLVGYGLDDDTAFSLLIDVYNPRCDPPWQSPELEEQFQHKIREIIEKGSEAFGWLELANRDRLAESLGAPPANDNARAAVAAPAIVPQRTDVRITRQALRDLRFRDILGVEKKLLVDAVADGVRIDDGSLPLLAKILGERFPSFATSALVEAARMSLSHHDEPERARLTSRLRELIDEQRDAGAAKVQIVGVQQQILDLLGGMPVTFNELSGQPELNGETCTDEHLALLRLACEHNGLGSPTRPVSKDVIMGCVLLASKKHSYHPVRDYLRALRWDGVHRELAAYLGADQVEADIDGGASAADEQHAAKDVAARRAYQTQVCTLWLRSAVARVMRPGCKVDTVLILEGQQGLFKSTAARVLISDAWSYEASTGEIGHKDFALDMVGKWCAEIPEIDRLIASRDESTLKAVLSKVQDRYRAPFDRLSKDHPRQMVFIGTTNRDDYLRDETGNRRYWPVRCGTIDLEGIRRDRDQLWAQAVAEFDRGEPWWLDGGTELQATAAKEQDERLERDAWLEPMRGVQLPDLFTTDEALDELPGTIAVEDRTQAHLARMGRVLRQLEYEKRSLWRGGRKQKLWRKTEPRNPAGTT